MRITVFGATGNVGSRVVAEALSRGHEVTAVVRNPDRRGTLPAGVGIRTGNAENPDQVAELSLGQDLVISATRPAPGQEDDLVKAARGLLAGLTTTGVRLLLVGGAGSLTVPGSGGTLLVDDPAYVPAAVRPIALACNDQLAVCQAHSWANWTYLSPPALLEPGERTGVYRRGTDELLVRPDGSSTISMEDFAVALLDEAETPRLSRARFTVAY
ncbi:NAD(P)-dependent oxidoreductase [Streptomyces sp. NPDC052396]|uniref:NAD(P)-dependent oxidoreductase n=1 Tax=Streptomyces sp. NPDC052396 TaxID=3365689 RepID=UPI0037D7958B